MCNNGGKTGDETKRQDSEDEARTAKVYFEWEPRDGQPRLRRV